MKKRKRAIGFQLTKNDGKNITEIPSDFWSFEILTMKVCKLWKKYNDETNEWEITPIYRGQIEEPTFRKKL